MEDIILDVLNNKDEKYYYNFSKHHGSLIIIGDSSPAKNILIKRLYGQIYNKHYTDTCAYIASSHPNEFSDCLFDNFNNSGHIYSTKDDINDLIISLNDEMNNRYEYLRKNNLKCSEYEFNRIILFLDDISASLKYLANKTDILRIGSYVGVYSICSYTQNRKTDGDIIFHFPNRVCFRNDYSEKFTNLSPSEFLYAPPGNAENLDNGYIKGTL